MYTNAYTNVGLNRYMAVELHGLAFIIPLLNPISGNWLVQNQSIALQ